MRYGVTACQMFDILLIFRENVNAMPTIEYLDQFFFFFSSQSIGIIVLIFISICHFKTDLEKEGKNSRRSLVEIYYILKCKFIDRLIQMNHRSMIKITKTAMDVINLDYCTEYMDHFLFVRLPCFFPLTKIISS